MDLKDQPQHARWLRTVEDTDGSSNASTQWQEMVECAMSTKVYQEAFFSFFHGAAAIALDIASIFIPDPRFERGVLCSGMISSHQRTFAIAGPDCRRKCWTVASLAASCR